MLHGRTISAEIIRVSPLLPQSLSKHVLNDTAFVDDEACAAYCPLSDNSGHRRHFVNRGFRS